MAEPEPFTIAKVFAAVFVIVGAALNCVIHHKDTLPIVLVRDKPVYGKAL